MATTPTGIGPIGARQINNSLYVGHNDLTTIQKAVSFAVAVGGIFTVYIPPEYAGADAITAVTGGTASVHLMDERSGLRQIYYWNGAQFQAQAFEQLSGFITTGVPAAYPSGSAAFYYDPTGTSGTGTGRISIVADTGMDMPSFEVVGHPSDGTSLIAFFRCQTSIPNVGLPAGIPQIEAPSQLALYNSGFDSYNVWVGGYYLAGYKGMTIWGRAAEDAIDLQGQTLGGAYDQTIRLNYLGGNVQIGPITFDGVGNIIGIQGITATSIAAGDGSFTTCEVANSPVRTFANTVDAPEGMIWPPIGLAVSAGTAWGTSINPATLATWPTSGVPVSTGTAWGTSINPVTLARYPATGVPVSTGTAWGTSINPATLATWPASGVPVSTGAAWGTPIPAANIPLLNATGNTFSGNLAAGMLFLTTPGTLTTASITALQPALATNFSTGIYVGQSTSNGFGVNFSFINFGSAAANRGGIGFINDPQAVFDNGGNWTFPNNLLVTGAFAAAVKNFRIRYPGSQAKDNRWLIHSSLEGADIAVYYRGESVTKGGWEEITLPDYFETLTRPEQRTVLLTAYFDNDDEPIGNIAAGRVKGGKFKVWSAQPTQKFYWEVKAVRNDVSPLKTEEHL